MKLFFKTAVLIIFSAAAMTSSAIAQEAYESKALKRDSAYETNGNAFFVRGGYAFDSTESLTIGDANALLVPFGVTLAGNPADEVFDTSSFYSSIGFRQKLNRAGNSMFSLEAEFLGAREQEDATIAGVPVEVRDWVLVPNAALRWQYNFDGAVAPYASVGVGPGILLTSIEASGVEESFSNVAFAYTGRAGLEFAVTPRFGIEAGYRFLGLTDDGSAGFHAGELGLNFKF